MMALMCPFVSRPPPEMTRQPSLRAAHRVFDAIKLFHDRKDIKESTKAKILANGTRFFSS
jgi:hypothetical protein